MKASNLLISFLAALCFCFGSFTLANTPQAETLPEVKATVNINEADARQLAQVLEGVGLSRAEAIVKYREKNGRFYSAEELSAVRGIGMATVMKNEDRIKVE